MLCHVAKFWNSNILHYFEVIIPTCGGLKKTVFDELTYGKTLKNLG